MVYSKVPNAFYHGFRKPNDQEVEVVRDSCAEEAVMRSRISNRHLFVFCLGFLYTIMGVTSDNSHLKVIGFLVGSICSLTVIRFVYNMLSWAIVSRSVIRGNFVVRAVNGYFPVLLGDSSFITVENGDGVAVELSSLYSPTKKMLEENWGDSSILLVLVGKSKRAIVIPTRLEYEYV